MDSSIQYNDKEIMKLISEGDKGAFTQLFKRYTPKLVPFISGLTKSDCITDEIVQETFLRAWLNREKLTTVNDPETWIFRITASVCYSFLKELMAENTIINIVRHESHYSNNEVVESARLYKLAVDIHHAIHNLSPEQKKVYRLSREHGMKVPEIADELAISPNNVRNLLNSSVEFLHDYLHEKQHSF